jgi:uncharacterized Fe-S cluster protein YjdI
MEEEGKIYTNGEISVLWKKELCQHSAICFRGLSKVFDPRKRPWVMMDGATSAEIVDQVGKCPSGALSIVKGK